LRFNGGKKSKKQRNIYPSKKRGQREGFELRPEKTDALLLKTNVRDCEMKIKNE
jgi:hypothetical protein